MKRGEILIAVLAAVAVGVVALLSAGDEQTDDPNSTAKPGAGALRLPFAYSPEKERLRGPLIERFNRERVESGGQAGVRGGRGGLVR